SLPSWSSSCRARDASSPRSRWPTACSAGARRSAATRSRSACTACAASSSPSASRSGRCAAWATCSRRRMAGPPTLRRKLLRGLLLPLTLVLLVDIAGSYVVIQAITRDIYDGELAEIARELVLHAQPDGKAFKFDLSADAERTLLLDQYDDVYFAVRDDAGRTVAGRPGLPAMQAAATGMTFGDALFEGKPVRMGALRTTLPNSTVAT